MAAEVGDAYEPKELIERVKSLEKTMEEMQRDHKAREERSSKQLQSLEKQLSLSHSNSLSPSSSLPSSPSMAGRSPRLAYSSSFKKPDVPSAFQMPLHYPKYNRSDYETMPEWKLDRLLEEYGLPVHGTIREKRQYAMGIFLWSKPDQQTAA